MEKGHAREQFAQYVNTIFGDAAPVTPAPEMPAPPVDYPHIYDGGEIPAERLPDMRPACDQFAEWMGGQMKFDPFKDPDGWTRFN